MYLISVRLWISFWNLRHANQLGYFYCTHKCLRSAIVNIVSVVLSIFDRDLTKLVSFFLFSPHFTRQLWNPRNSGSRSMNLRQPHNRHSGRLHCVTFLQAPTQLALQSHNTNMPMIQHSMWHFTQAAEHLVQLCFIYLHSAAHHLFILVA